MPTMGGRTATHRYKWAAITLLTAPVYSKVIGRSCGLPSLLDANVKILYKNANVQHEFVIKTLTSSHFCTSTMTFVTPDWLTPQG